MNRHDNLHDRLRDGLHDDPREEPRETFARMRRDLLAKQTGRLAQAAGRPSDEATRRAFAEIAAECRPDTIDSLVALLRGLRAVAPQHIGAFPVVAFIRHGQQPGMQPHRGVAVTAETGRYNVHTVFWNEDTARWEGQNGRYGVSWEAARDDLNDRVDMQAQP
jgi:hypothetical protein